MRQMPSHYKLAKNFAYNGSSFVDKTPSSEEIIEIGEIITVEQLIDRLFKKFDGRFNTGPYGQFDLKDTIKIDLNKSLEEIFIQMESKAVIDYRKTCSNCYELNALTFPK